MSFPDRIRNIQQRIGQACQQFGKDPAQIRLLAVSKTFPASAVEEVFAAGLTEFGENYVQEGVDKINTLAKYRQQMTWHFIGPLQSNKTKDVAEHFDWMHSVDREKIARRLSEQRPADMAPLQICLQINTSGEASKSGVDPSEAIATALAIAGLPRLTLRGLMSIPEPTDDTQLQRQQFAALTALFQKIKQQIPLEQQQHFNVLSMGMSSDLESAVAESIPEATTIVRIGTALFGVREKK
ncbi:YggS family pyridoxal phosphate-dependent enzyme [beta proteobacterium MWH-UniP1]